MKEVSSYYAKVLFSITMGQTGRFKDKVVERIMQEDPELIDHVDALRERLKRHLVPLAPAGADDAEISEGALDTDNDDARSVSLSLPHIQESDVQAPDVQASEHVLADTDDDKDLPIMADREEEQTPSNENSALRPGELPLTSSAQNKPLPPETRTESLPNGRAGQHYALCLDDVLALPEQVTLTLEDDAETGLVLTDDRCLQGELSGAGTVQLIVAGRNAEGHDALLLTLRLAVIPSSRDLWKNLPSDPNAPYAKPDEDSARVMLPDGWQMAMASQRGRAHAHHGGQRDDHGIITQTDSGWQLLIVADGAGSCEFSRQGSRLAATAAANTLQGVLNDAEQASALEETVLAYWASEDRSTRIPQPLVQRLQSTVITAVHQAHLAIHEEAEASGHPIKAFSTTLLLALHKPTPQGHIVISFGVGDGAIAVLEQGGDIHLMNNADSGEHAGQTRFLDSALFQDVAGLYQRLKVIVVEPLKSVVLATDGITDPKFSSDRELQDAGVWQNFFSTLMPSLENVPNEGTREPLLDYLSFFIERHHDDRTLAVLFNESLLAAPADASSEAEGGDNV